jgi:hypothetical protein
MLLGEAPVTFALTLSMTSRYVAPAFPEPVASETKK